MHLADYGPAADLSLRSYASIADTETSLIAAQPSDPGSFNPAITTSGNVHPVTDQSDGSAGALPRGAPPNVCVPLIGGHAHGPCTVGTPANSGTQCCRDRLWS